MCNQFTYHHQFRIDTRRSKFEQQKDRILSVDPMDKSHKDPDDIDLSERYHSSRNTSSLLYPKLETSYTRRYMRHIGLLQRFPWIQDVGNVELFELFETDTKTQCKECLPHWSEGIVHCTCGHLLKESAAEASFNIHWTFSQFQTT